jgi:hypothetical protein
VTSWPVSVAFPLTLLVSIALVLAYDALSASIAARNPAFPYRNLWPLQFALYVVIGFVASLTVLDPRLVAAIGALTGLAEATAGWTITWRIGPGRVANGTPARIAVVIASMTAFGFGLALLGAWLFVLAANALTRAPH